MAYAQSRICPPKKKNHKISLGLWDTSVSQNPGQNTRPSFN